MINSLPWQAIEKTEYLTDKVVGGCTNAQSEEFAPCLWLRGILPVKLLAKYLEAPTMAHLHTVAGGGLRPQTALLARRKLLH